MGYNTTLTKVIALKDIERKNQIIGIYCYIFSIVAKLFKVE